MMKKRLYMERRTLLFGESINASARTCRLALMALLIVPLVGCKLLNTSAGMPDKQGRVRFAKHNFSAYCFNTYECRVDYDNYRHADIQAGKRSPPVPSDWSKSADAGYGGIRNFPDPATVIWRSLDGVHHETYVDIGRIFSSEQVVHRVPPKEIKMDGAVLSPDVILAVDDREIRVYMRAMIPLNYPKKPSNPYSFFEDDLILVHSKKY
ncbi:hypothetical protein L2Y94_20955 [Luteibacter aegosomatis]|uniref:hypothetical protein n=1 Tax=Luteibacter aegosomatis TaxID=2911537 RepID=UPI001FFB24C8|nr:hypothetical protein [Luteibacter aegosomatis]UPG85730.1 hypothetical protein L2Y94_20955 [Luteibacter aegosomatis]